MYKAGFTMLPNDIIRGGHGAHNIAVLLTVHSHGECWASLQKISDEIGCARRIVIKSIMYWEKKGVLTKIKTPGRTSTIMMTSEQKCTGVVNKSALVPVHESAHKEYYIKNTIEVSPINKTWDIDQYLIEESKRKFE